MKLQSIKNKKSKINNKGYFSIKNKNTKYKIQNTKIKLLPIKNIKYRIIK